MARQADYLPALLENIQKQLDRLEDKQDKQTEVINATLLQTQKTNGRVTRAEKEIVALQRAKGRTSFRLTPEVLAILKYVFLIAAAVVTAMLGYNLKDILPL